MGFIGNFSKLLVVYEFYRFCGFYGFYWCGGLPGGRGWNQRNYYASLKNTGFVPVDLSHCLYMPI